MAGKVRTEQESSTKHLASQAQAGTDIPVRPPLSSAVERGVTSDPTVTRFAPSPTGFLHLGHARSALEGWRAARGDGGRFLLRLEDIDQTRCRDEYAAAIIEDLVWLGLGGGGPVRREPEALDDNRRRPDA